MNKSKTKIEDKVEKQVSDIEITSSDIAPPDTHYLAERYIVELPVSDPHFGDPWKLRLHVAKVLERQLGDSVQLTSMKVKKPRLIRKGVARLRHQEPCVRMFVTVKF